MASIPTQNSGTKASYSVIPDDVYEARITRVVFNGMQKQRPYKGQEKPDQVTARVTFELIGETVTQTKEGEEKDFPAVVSYEINVPSDCERGKAADLLAATLGLSKTPRDTDTYEQLIGAPVMVQVGSYLNQYTSNQMNCVNGVSAMGNRAKGKLEEAQADPLFFCCYTDSEEMKNAYASLPNWQQEKLSGASDKHLHPWLIEAWATELPQQDEEGNTESDEF